MLYDVHVYYALASRIRNRTDVVNRWESFESVSVDQSNGLFGRTNSWSRYYIVMPDACNFIETVSDRIVLTTQRRDSSIAFWCASAIHLSTAAKEIQFRRPFRLGAVKHPNNPRLLPLFASGKENMEVQTGAAKWSGVRNRKYEICVSHSVSLKRRRKRLCWLLEGESFAHLFSLVLVKL